MLLSDRDIKASIAEGRLGLDPYDAGLVQPSSIDVRLDRYFRVFNNSRYTHIDPALQQADLTTTDPPPPPPRETRPPPRAGGGGGGGAVRPAPGGVRAGLDAGGRDPSRRHRGPARGQELARAPGAPPPLAGRLRRPGILRPHHAGALQRGQPADHALAGHEDRPALHVPAQQPGRASVRLGRLRLPLPGPARPDAVPVLPQLHPRGDASSVLTW